MSGLICYCINCPGDEDKENSTCVLKPGAQCYASLEEQFNPETKTFEPIYAAGCLPPDEQTLLQCKGNLVPSLFMRTIKCCNFTDYCNKNLLPPYKPRSTTSSPIIAFENLHLAPFLVSFTLCFVLLFLCITYLYYKYKKSDESCECLTELYSIKVQKCRNNLQDFLNSSGSGAGKSLLERNTLRHQVQKEYLLGKGRFSEKWVAKWKEEKIVMKIFSTFEEDQWIRERKIYSTGISHENILGYIGADVLNDGSRAIFTYYLEEGSLHDYLKYRCVNDIEFFALTRSAANGINCLHTEVLSTFRRPSIAHRNIKSQNFLIRNGQCVISDFEIALIDNENLNLKLDLRMGTPRYAAPEIVNENISSINFSQFKSADVYSFGLVLWEICRRYASIAEEYSLPFANILPEYPTMEDMKVLFSSKKSIQDILIVPTSWEKDQILANVALSIKECVRENGGARPTMMRICKRLNSQK